MDRFSHSVVQVTQSLVRRAAPGQGGLFSGDNPSAYNINDTFRLWVIQVFVIVALTQLLSVGLSRIRQPRVIAEVIGGVILGPTIMGRIPNFLNRIFPAASMPILNLTSNIGLVFFLFIVGVELDAKMIKRRVKSAFAISVAGLLLPLGLGAALGIPIYHQFIDPSINYGYFLLFTAVAIGITAFPVLCRILTETKLLDTTVGVTVLSAGVGNDVVGWILLALSVALVNADSGLTALWVLLASVGYVIFLIFPVKWSYVWLARRTGSLETGQPTPFVMTVTLMIVLISAFFTDVIGVHAIFGGFLAGLIIPHDNGFAISLVEKLEDLISIIFLPIYFALSGLRTNLGLLNNGITWGYTILICVVAFFSKFIGCATAAKLTGFNYRESGAIGALMSCKGLVELIVLNVGLQAGILDTRTFSMFVVHALILTCMTTPLTLLLYPAKYRVRDGVSDNSMRPGSEEGGTEEDRSGEDTKTHFTVVLDNIDHLSAAMNMAQLLGPSSSSSTLMPLSDAPSLDEKGFTSAYPRSRPVVIDALRLIELTDRTSAVFKSQAIDALLHSDPVLSVFKTFGYLHRLIISANLSVVSFDQFSYSVAQHVRESSSQMVIVPWSTGMSSDAGFEEGTTGVSTHNPFDNIFRSTSANPAQKSSVVYSEFIRRLFADSPVDVALFIDHGVPSGSSVLSRQHLFLPFFGGPDDRLALSFVVQLCNNENVSATVVRITKTESNFLSPVSTIEQEKERNASPILHNTLGFGETIYGNIDTTTRLASDTADNLVWERYASPHLTHNIANPAALSRVSFVTHASPQPLHTVVEMVTSEQRSAPVVAVLGRSRRLAVESHQAELRNLITEKGRSIGSDILKTLGDVGAALIAAGTNASLLVVQAVPGKL